MIHLKLAMKSIRNRSVSAFLTILSIALSVVLLLSVERSRRAAQDGFTNSISKVDLLVGGRTGPLNLILYTVFNMGNPSNNVTWESYQEIKNLPEVDWTIPYSLGDSHKGFRVVATDENFYTYYQYRGDGKIEFSNGSSAKEIWDVVIGSEVADQLKYNLGQDVVIAHGVTKGDAVVFHEDKPFKIVGILKPTGTAVDQSIYITLQGMEAIHLDWTSGAVPNSQTSIAADKIDSASLKIKSITSFFVRAKSRIQTLKLQRDINEFDREPLMAIIPGATLSELWRGLSQIEIVLKIISVLVMIVGFASMVSSLLSSLNERRREMAILRSVGASPTDISLLLVIESTFLTAFGIIIGLFLQLTTFFLLRDWIEAQYGFYLRGTSISQSEVIYLLFALFIGCLMGLIPAIRASRMALKDGLTIKV